MSLPKIILFSADKHGTPMAFLPEMHKPPKEIGDRLFEIATELEDLSDGLPLLRRDLRSTAYLIRSIVLGHPDLS